MKLIAALVLIVIMSGCSSIKSFDYTNWWDFHKNIFQSISDSVKSSKTTTTIETTEVK